MKNLRRFVLAFTLLLLFAMTLTACGGGNSEGGAATDNEAAADTGDAVSEFAPYRFAVNTWGAGVPIMDVFGDDAQYTSEMLGMTVTRASNDFTADRELQNVQNFASAGVDGMVLQAGAVSTVPQIGQICKDVGIPFAFYVFIGTDEEMDKLAAENEYYAGSAIAQMLLDGEMMGKAAYENGARTAVLIGGNVGEITMDQRGEGFRRGFESLGGTVLGEARCTDPSECPPKAMALMNAYPDADALFSMVGDYVPGSLEAIKSLGLDTKVFVSCVDEESAKLIKSGEIVTGNDGISLASFIAPTLVLNYLDGHPILDPDGKAPVLRTAPFRVTQENVDAYLSIFVTEGVEPVADSILKNLCYRYNPDVSYDDYVNLIESGLTLNALLESHGLPTVD
jgi:ABC-type sugar transport system substrate-binding protein